MKGIYTAALLVLGLVVLVSAPARASDPMFGSWSEWYNNEEWLGQR